MTAHHGVDLATPRVPPRAVDARTHVWSGRADVGAIAARVLGAGLLVTTGALHLDLYVTGYRTIPTIGVLFLLQVITAFALGLCGLLAASGIGQAVGKSP